jgi:hypothetical protein
MTAREETNLLLRAAIGVAELQLKRGQILHFAVTLGSEKNAKTLFTEDLERNASRADLEQFWGWELKNAVDSETRAVCYCANVRVPLGEQGPVPCIFVHFEHVEGRAEDMVFPYSKDESANLVVKNPLSRPAKQEILSQK